MFMFLSKTQLLHCVIRLSNTMVPRDAFFVLNDMDFRLFLTKQRPCLVSITISNVSDGASYHCLIGECNLVQFIFVIIDDFEKKNAINRIFKSRSEVPLSLPIWMNVQIMHDRKIISIWTLFLSKNPLWCSVKMPWFTIFVCKLYVFDVLFISIAICQSI